MGAPVLAFSRRNFLEKAAFIGEVKLFGSNPKSIGDLLGK
jgi:hypothetical protein